MFTKEEREKIDKIIKLGFVDTFRKFHQKGGYTWWLRGFDTRERNIGKLIYYESLYFTCQTGGRKFY